MDRPFHNSLTYLFENYIEQVGQAGVCVYGAMLKLIQRGNMTPTYEEVASAAGCKEWTLRNTFDKLASYGIITKVSRRDKKGSKLSNLYKLNDPDTWLLVSEIPAMNITNTPPAMNFTNTPALNFTNGVDNGEIGDITSVSGPLVTPAMDFMTPPAVNFTAPSSSSSSFFLSSTNDLNTTNLEQDRADLPTTDVSFTNSQSRDPRERAEVPPSKNDAPFQKIERMWYSNSGKKLNAATEEALWGFYVKYGDELLREGLNTAFTENTRGNWPSMRFLEAILSRLEATKRADEIRRKEMEYRANPQAKPETSDVDYTDKSKTLIKLFSRFKEKQSDQKEDEGNG